MSIVATLEAILFASKEPISIPRLARAMEVDEKEVSLAADALRELYQGRGIALSQIAGGLVIETRQEFLPQIERALSRRTQSALSKGALETLAVIAYRQPVTRQDIEGARGVNPEASIETLMEKGLIREAGRRKTLGRPKLYATTDEFLVKAGLNSLSDLPPLTPEEP